MMMIEVREGWLISETEAAQLEQQELERILIQRAW